MYSQIKVGTGNYLLFNFRYRAENRWDIVKTYNNTFFVHPLDGEVFAQVINLSNKYDVSVYFYYIESYIYLKFCSHL